VEIIKTTCQIVLNVDIMFVIGVCLGILINIMEIHEMKEKKKMTDGR